MNWKVISPIEENKQTQTQTQMVYAGYEVEVFRGQPPRVDGWSIVLAVESQDAELVTGHMKFPERAHFEFDGSFAQMLKVMQQAEGGRALFALSSFTFWRM